MTSEVEHRFVFIGHLLFFEVELPSLWVPIPSLFVMHLPLSRRQNVERALPEETEERNPHIWRMVDIQYRIRSSTWLVEFQPQSSWLVFPSPLVLEQKKAFCLNPGSRTWDVWPVAPKRKIKHMQLGQNEKMPLHEQREGSTPGIKIGLIHGDSLSRLDAFEGSESSTLCPEVLWLQSW